MEFNILNNIHIIKNELKEFIDKHNSTDVYLLGDLNFPQIHWKTISIKSGKSTWNNFTKNLEEPATNAKKFKGYEAFVSPLYRY